MNCFEKVSLEEFLQDCHNLGYTDDEMLKKAYDGIVLPHRSTSGSAGYDFVSPIEADLSKDHPVVVIPTGVRVALDKDKVLLLVPRSGLGFKTGVRLSNTIGVIDSDYYFAKNEGHIMTSLTYGFKDLHIAQGDRFMQGMILSYFTTDDDEVKTERTGGFGSTGKN